MLVYQRFKSECLFLLKRVMIHHHQGSSLIINKLLFWAISKIAWAKPTKLLGSCFASFFVSLIETSPFQVIVVITHSCCWNLFCWEDFWGKVPPENSGYLSLYSNVFMHCVCISFFLSQHSDVSHLRWVRMYIHKYIWIIWHAVEVGSLSHYLQWFLYIPDGAVFLPSTVFKDFIKKPMHVPMHVPEIWANLTKTCHCAWDRDDIHETSIFGGWNYHYSGFLSEMYTDILYTYLKGFSETRIHDEHWWNMGWSSYVVYRLRRKFQLIVESLLHT